MNPQRRLIQKIMLVGMAFIATIFVLLNIQHGAEKISPANLVTTGSSPNIQKTTPSDQPLADCVSPDTVKDLLGQKLDLVYEEWVPVTHLRWCRYLDSESTETAPAQLEYKLSNVDAEKNFNDKKNLAAAQNTFHQLADQPQAFAIVNPVKELHQVQFFLRDGEKYLEVTFSAPNFDEGQLIEKGFQLAKKVISQ